jgi:hypothetical protein
MRFSRTIVSTTLINSCLLISLVVALPSSGTGQTDSSHWEFFPDRTIFAPFMANHEEPRMGFQQEIGNSPMKVAIGNAVPVFEHRSTTDTLQGSLLFFAYAQANDYRGYRLKIDAADGFFGLAFSYHWGSPLSFRFRMLHLSAHLVDGHYNDATMQWRDNKIPFPYSRNYGELSAAYAVSPGAWPIRVYSGFSYAPIIKPKVIKGFSVMAGWEVHSPGATHAYAAQHFYLLGTPTYIGSNTIEAGVKFGNAAGRGIRLFLVYQNGWDNFCEYYNERKEFVGAGFAVEFWGK